jgi:hypothetical protein
VHRQDEHRDLRLFRQQRCRSLRSGQAGHREIGDHHVGSRRPDNLEELDPAGSLARQLDAGLTCQYRGESVPVHGVVDDDTDRGQNWCGHGWRWPGRLTVRHVPAGEDVTAMVPPHDSALCRIEIRPSPSGRNASMPAPLSLTSIVIASEKVSRTAHWVAPEWRRTLVIASG